MPFRFQGEFGQKVLKFILVVMIVILANVAGVLAQVEPVKSFIADSTDVGWVRLTTDYPMHSVWYDSIRIPIGEDGVVQLPAGEHVLRIEGNDLINWFLRDAKTTVRVKPDDTIRIAIVFPKYAMIYSDPYSAEIWANGQLLGSTPYLLAKEEESLHSFTLKKSGYQDSTLVLLDRMTPGIWISLRKDVNDFRHQNQILQIKTIKQEKQTRLTLFTFGLTLASGSAAYLLKKEANRNYDRYQVAGNLEDINHYYNLTRRYDRLATGSYIVFEINLLASAYLFFRYILKP